MARSRSSRPLQAARRLWLLPCALLVGAGTQRPGGACRGASAAEAAAPPCARRGARGDRGLESPLYDVDDVISMLQTRVLQTKGDPDSVRYETNNVSFEATAGNIKSNSVQVAASPRKTAAVNGAHPEAPSTSLTSASAANVSARPKVATAFAKELWAGHAHDPLGKYMKQIDAPSYGWAIASLVCFCLLVLGTIGFTVWLGLRSSEEKPLCSWPVAIAASIFSTICLVLVGYLVITYFSGALLQHLIMRYDTAFLGVEVKTQKVTLNPFSGQLTVTKLEVLNPPGYSSDYLLRARSLFIDLDMAGLILSFFNKAPVQTVNVTGVSAIYEQALTSSNVLDLVDRLEGEQKPQKSGTEVLLHEVSLTDCKVKATVTLLGSTGVSLAVPDIFYKDFNKQVGANKIGAIIDIILRTLLQNILGVEAKANPKLVSSAAASKHSAAPAGMVHISNTTK